VYRFQRRAEPLQRERFAQPKRNRDFLLVWQIVERALRVKLLAEIVKRTGRFKLHRFALGEEFGDGVVISRVVGHVLYICVCVYVYMRADFARSFSVSVVWIFENFLCVRCYSRDVTNVQKKRDECSGVIVVRTNSLRDETGCFWRDVCVCVCVERSDTRSMVFASARVNVEKLSENFEFFACNMYLGC
jgi:hypothetical protein